MLVQIAEAIEGWPCEKIADNWYVDRQLWLPVTEEFYDHMLGVLPPEKMFNGGFLVGEPYSHERMLDGKYAPTYTAVVIVDDKYYAKHCFASSVENDYADLKKHLQG